MCDGAVAAIACSWPVAVRSVTWTARVFEFSIDPAERLTGQLLHVSPNTVADQLGQGGGQELRSSAITVAFQLMPLPVPDAEALMQLS